MNNRRQFLKGLAATAVGGLMVEPQELFAETLTATPGQTEGPYYPATLPLDTDNDLVVINNNLTSAVGEITYLSGRILQPNGDPVRMQPSRSGRRTTLALTFIRQASATPVATSVFKVTAAF